jgi:hypothetical protein
VTRSARPMSNIHTLRNRNYTIAVWSIGVRIALKTLQVPDKCAGPEVDVK